MAAVKTETTEFNPTIRNHDAQAKTIMEIVSQFIDRFILLPTPDLYVLVSAWILATHLHQHFDYLGYLLAYSPEKESGKTTLLKVLDLVVFQSTGLQVFTPHQQSCSEPPKTIHSFSMKWIHGPMMPT